ncbi:FAD/NAD(P)-binding protein [Pseudomonas sp. WAC2]|uniref:FAD/NAD(P)-binding protein n=1 Tax=Pseudomonas sp. WAC2 TaxID=3055057 RepID=UPI0025B231BC|nr:FAD/NAD(P)-binding protein [Pseudomonas sp. WAC2]MDN3238069.1 FAD/NAD(P)-binding protein [Pseudomonas sp. WAC2]
MENTDKDQSHVLIIGGGLSGALLAINLLRKKVKRKIIIFDTRTQLGHGLAYSTNHLVHTLNNIPSKLSIDPNNSEDFSEWLLSNKKCERESKELYPPRKYFGEYVLCRLNEAIDVGKTHGTTLTFVNDEVTNLQDLPNQVIVSTKNNGTWFGNVAVIATGLSQKSKTDNLQSELSGLIFDPWDIEGMREIKENARILIVGSGLTMVDALFSLKEINHNGSIHVISRHGLIPHPRIQSNPWPDFLKENKAIKTPRQALSIIRSECKKAQSAGFGWQAPIDAIRSSIGELWYKASDAHKRQFIHHLRALWENHLHRCPPAGYDLIKDLQEKGLLTFEASKLISLNKRNSEISARIKRKCATSTQDVEFDHVIIACGMDYDWTHFKNGLSNTLIFNGTVRPGPLNIGIMTNAAGRIIDKSNKLSERLFALGPPLRGVWWECTSISSIAMQAKALCELI